MARQTEGVVAVPVRTVEPAAETKFVPGEVYLEVRILQMWLNRERELLREYLPFGTVVTDFARRGERVTVPFVLGSAEINRRLAATGAGDGIDFGNIRVAGPVPYEGDDVTLLMALFRYQTTDWLTRSLTFLEEVVTAVGLSGLAASTPVASTLVRGLDAFLGHDEVQLRVGACYSWVSPGGSPAGDPVAAELAPMNFAVIRRPRTRMAESELNALRAKDGRLCRQISDGAYEPYTEHDFILVSIEAREYRDDYRKLPFYEFWEQSKRHLIDGDLSAARRAWRQTVGAIFTDELTRPQQQKLFTEYEKLFVEMVDRFTAGEDSAWRGEDGQRGTEIVDDPETLLRTEEH
jgi:hypothetical protein